MWDWVLFLIKPMAILIIAPWAAWVVAAVFFVLGGWRGSRSALVVGGLWLLYGGYEGLMYLRILCSGECNIRIDLLVIYPLLAVLSLAAVITVAWPRRGSD